MAKSARSIATQSQTFAMVSITGEVDSATHSDSAISFKLMCAGGARVPQQNVADAAPLDDDETSATVDERSDEPVLREAVGQRQSGRRRVGTCHLSNSGEQPVRPPLPWCPGDRLRPARSSPQKVIETFPVGQLDRAADRGRILFVPIDPQGLVERCVQVSHRNRAFGHLPAPFVASPHHLAAAKTPAPKGERPACGPVVAAVFRIQVRRAAELSHHQHDGRGQQAPLLEVPEQDRQAGVE